MGLDAIILVFWMLSFKPTFLLSSEILWNSEYLKTIKQKKKKENNQQINTGEKEKLKYKYQTALIQPRERLGT